MKMLAMTVLCVDKDPELNLEIVGGNSLNIAVQWSRLGQKDIAVLGAVGMDYLSNMASASLGFASGDIQMAESLIEFSKTIQNPIFITAGEEGSYCVYEGQLYFEPSAPVEKKIDSIGCGDSYQAGFIVSWYSEHDVQKAMKAGAKAASYVLQRYGGVV